MVAAAQGEKLFMGRRPGCELSEKSKMGQNKGSSPPLSSLSSPLSLQPPPPPDESDVQSARGLAPIAGGSTPQPPGNSHTGAAL
jgi:hypothetical protein